MVKVTPFRRQAEGRRVKRMLASEVDVRQPGEDDGRARGGAAAAASYNSEEEDKTEEDMAGRGFNAVAVIMMEREREGRCSQCGTQTHSFALDSVPQKVVLNIEGEILNGRCLFCMPLRHDFKVGDSVKILRDSKNRENAIATVVKVCPLSVRVRIGESSPFYKRVTTIQKD